MIEKFTEKLTFDFVQYHAIGTLKVLRVLGVGLPILGGVLLFWNFAILGFLAVALATVLNLVAYSTLKRILAVPASIANQIGESADLQKNIINIMSQLGPGLSEFFEQMGGDSGNE